ncbi:MAG TPA: hypothetical protein VF910_08320 [Candidatus Bathyarchaeia archaeon]
MHSPVLLHSPWTIYLYTGLAAAAMLVVGTALVLEQRKCNNSAQVARRNGPPVHVTGDFVK